MGSPALGAVLMTLWLHAGDSRVPSWPGRVFTGLAPAGGAPADSRQDPPARSALTLAPAPGAPEPAGCQLATAAPGPWGSFLPGGTKRRSGHCSEVCTRRFPHLYTRGSNQEQLATSRMFVVVTIRGVGTTDIWWIEARDGT